MRRTPVVAAASCVLLTLSMSSALAGDDRPKTTKAPAKQSARPSAVNPYLALLDDRDKKDHSTWKRFGTAQAERRANSEAQRRVQARERPPVLVDEEEPRGVRGSNESPATAQRVPQFGTQDRKRHRARVLGALSPEPVEVDEIAPNTEDDGSIPLARRTGIGNSRAGIETTGVIGDGPHGSEGSGSGDFDVYRLRAVAGEEIVADVDLVADSELDSMVAIYDAAGELVAFNDDADFDLSSEVRHPVRRTGAYYVLVSGYAALPEDPQDSGSGDGAGSEGPYSLRITAAETDSDFYAFRLRKGDVLGASVEGSAGRLAIYDAPPNREDVHGSSQDLTFLYPSTSPLPGGGNAVTEHVADQDGWHFVAVEEGSGAYDLTVEAYRPGREGQRPVQTLFLDFDGARVNTGVFGGTGVSQLSPLRAFLGRWGMRNADLNPLITAVVAEARENLRRDLVASGGNANFDVRILNSRDHADPWGQPNVSRVIVGGTIDESGVPTIGIAQSIDPGNFEAEETALLLLDLLSDPAGESGGVSLNDYLRPRSDKVAFVAQALGNLVAHEAGHLLGNWHVEPFNDVPNLMDSGGNFEVMFGVGPDGVGGTADDDDVDFGEDVFDEFEGFTGIEDTLTRTAFGLTR
jgi:hypothetical protein